MYGGIFYGFMTIVESWFARNGHPMIGWEDGFVAHTAACVVTAPLDLARRRLQLQGQLGGGEDVVAFTVMRSWPRGSGVGGRYLGVVDCLSAVAKRDGVAGWFSQLSLPQVMIYPIHHTVSNIVISEWPSFEKFLHEWLQ